jgi:hypothetical protein
MNIRKTTNYKVIVKTANEAQATLQFNMEPTADLIVEALEATKREVPPVASQLRGEALKTDQSRYERALKRMDNLMALVRMTTIKLPTLSSQERNAVLIAGFEVGYVNIQASEAWTLA